MSVVSLVNREKVRQGPEAEKVRQSPEVWHDGAAATRRYAPTPEAECGKPRQICQMAEDYNCTIRLCHQHRPRTDHGVSGFRF